jgi:ABC-type transport system involved in multi-copper enzyme maturation permease subunit
LIQGVDRKNSIIGLAITIATLFITYAVGARGKYLDEDYIHVCYVLMFITIGSIFNMVLSATCITSEKESRAWPILLATSMDDWQILLGKAMGVFRRCLPIWLLLGGHVVLFVLVRYIHPIAIVHLSMFVTGLIVFLTSVGIYFSARLRRTTSAVVAIFALALLLWAVLPTMLGILAGFGRDYDDAFEAYISANPMAEAAVIMHGAGGAQKALRQLSGLNYNWPNRGWEGVGPTTVFVLIVMLIYIFVGLLFAWRAKCRFRCNIF